MGYLKFPPFTHWIKTICLLGFFIGFKPKNDKKIPVDKCDSYTRLLQMNPPSISQRNLLNQVAHE